MGFENGISVTKPEKITSVSFDDISEDYFEISYKSGANGGRLIRFENQFICHDLFKMTFNNIHREAPREIGAFGVVFRVEDTLYIFFEKDKINEVWK